MDANTIVTVISSLGFPIVMCGVMAYFVKYQTDKHREEMSTLNKEHKEEVEKLNTQNMEAMNDVKDAIVNNTIALQKLCDKLGGD